MSEIKMIQLLEVIKNSLADVHIETGRKDQFDNVCNKLVEDLTNAYDDNQAEIADLKQKVSDLILSKATLNKTLTNSVDLHNAVVIENNELKAQVELLSNPSCSGIGGNAVNEVGWWLNDWLTSRGEINGHQFNNLKPMFCEVVSFYASKVKVATNDEPTPKP